MNNHYIVIADHGHLRIFAKHQDIGQSTPTLEEVQSLDFPQGRASYVDNDTDMAGRFQSSNYAASGAGSPGMRQGMSIDERLPMQREMNRRRNADVAREIDRFLLADATATWDFAADTSVHNAIIDALSSQVRFRLRDSIPKDLVKQPIDELLGHFHRHAA